MAVPIDKLITPFRLKVEELLVACRDHGVEMVPYCAIRSPYEQARLWRQSRSTQVVKANIRDLENQGATFLAQCLESVGPQDPAEHVTNAIPGLSWHQWGEAVDCFWEVDGKAIWSTSQKIDGVNGYQVYRQQAERLGLRSGASWRDYPHVQFQQDRKPLISIVEIDHAMRDRFG